MGEAHQKCYDMLMKLGKMPTRELSFRQNKVLGFWINSGRKSKAKAIRDAGYSEAIARQPHKVFGSPAVKKWLEQNGYGEHGIELPHAPLKRRVVQYEIATNQKPTLDPSQLSEEQILQLRELLDGVPDPQPSQNGHTRQEIIPSYTPSGVGVDLFSAEAKWETRRSDYSNFSSM